MGNASAAWKLWLTLLLVSVAVFIGGEEEWLAIIPGVIIHELGHYTAARLCGVRTGKLRADFWGLRMDMTGMISYGKECLIALFGPLSNFLTAGMVGCLMVGGILPPSEPLSLFVYASLGLGTVNLLPVDTMDGGRILSAGISILCSPAVARSCVRATTALCLGILWLLSAYALLKGAPVLSLFLFCFTLILRFSLPRSMTHK